MAQCGALAYVFTQFASLGVAMFCYGIFKMIRNRADRGGGFPLIAAIKKNSKLRMHYLNMVHMNNTMRAFVHLYKLETHLEETQMLLLKTLIAVENRKNRAWFLADKAVLGKALEAYEALVTSATKEELTEVFEVKKRHHRDCKWLVHRDKDGALEITGCKSVLTVAL